jgi:hypothetical protein
MDNDIELSVAINLIERKIANLNIKMVDNPNEEIKKELDKYLTLKKEIYSGNVSRIKEIINCEED